MVEDDEAFASELSTFLESFEFEVTVAKSVDDMWLRLGSGNFRLIILDQFLSGQNALTSVASLVERFGVPVVMLTNNADAIDRIMGLELGADDFIHKMRPPREILARIRAVLRRAEKVVALPALGSWRVDHKARSIVTPRGAALDLTAQQYDTLLFLAARHGRLVSRDDISLAIFQRRFGGGEDRAVDNLVSRLRTNLERHLDGAEAIQSIRGQGYVFTGFVLVDSETNFPLVEPAKPGAPMTEP